MNAPIRRSSLPVLLLTLALACGDAPERSRAEAPAATPQGVAQGPAQTDVEEARALLGRLADAATQRGSSVVEGTGDWLLLASELRHLSLGPFWGADAAAVSRAQDPSWADPLPAMLDLREQLANAGIPLLFVPVPAKAAVVPTAVPGLGALDGRLDVQDVAFYELLRKRGIETLDLLPVFQKHEDPGSLYCKTDTHWSGRGAEVAATAIAEWVLGLEAFPPGRKTFDTEEREVEIRGDLGRMSGQRPPPSETLALRFVGPPGAPGDGLAPDPKSPVLLLGDSHSLVFSVGGDLHARGAGLPEQLAAELGIVPDVVAVRGSGATPSRISLSRRADGLRGKRAVVWVLSVRELTESVQGWRKVPVIR